MKRWMLIATLVAAAAHAQIDTTRVIEDAIVLDRVAALSRRDLPTDLLRRMVNEDIEILRGPRPDGSYQYASWERLESARTSESFSVQTRGDRAQTVEMRGTHVYRVILDSPGRRMLVAKNRPVHIERVDVEYIPIGGTTAKVHSTPIGAPLVPGENRPIDLPEIARQATVRVIAKADDAYGNIVISLVQARIVDSASSPYAGAVSAAKAALRALDNGEIPSLRAMAVRMRDALGGGASESSVTVSAPRVEAVPANDLYGELQAIEDLLTGNERERREGLDKLHQLVRRLRPR